MRRKFTAMLLALILLFGLGTSAYAMTEEQSAAIQSFLDDVQRISGAPGVSAVVVSSEGTRFFSSGVANSETGVSADENTLWELASVSKAFTALGLLYMEEQGLLSLSDSIADHLPWLTFQYNGRPIDMRDVRLYHFMYHTVGITNPGHFYRSLERSEPDSLLSAVEALIDAELVFLPGERMDYGTKNYEVLGLVMEAVSGQSYESFMEERIFGPLGMTSTFAYRDHAYETGRMSQGYATCFIFIARPNDSHLARGSVPTGFIISSTYDMARWMSIQLGLVDDIPEIFRTIITRSHQADMSVPPNFFWGAYHFYAAGWIVNEDKTIVQHPGDNPGFATHLKMWPDEGVGIAFLSNSNNTNGFAAANGIRGILQGDLDQSYSMSAYQIGDITFTVITVVAGLLAVLLSFLGLRRIKQEKRHPLTQKRLALIASLSIITLAMCILVFILPNLIYGTGANWSLAFMYSLYSILTGIIALMLLCASAVWFVCSKTTIK